jgi:tetratricopeptide (TPR) repeat protein
MGGHRQLWAVPSQVYRSGVSSSPSMARETQDLAATGEIVLAAAVRAADLTGQAHAHHHLGKALARGGRYQDARGHLQRAVALLAQLRDRSAQADAELSLVEALCELDELAPALARSAHALRLYRAVGHHAGQARALNSVGWVHLLLGRYQTGLTYCERAVELTRQADDPYTRYLQVSALDSIAYAHHLLGHHTMAIAGYRRALRAHPAEGETVIMAIVLDHLGDSYQADGARADALRAWGRATSIFEGMQHPAADRMRAKISDAGWGGTTPTQELSALPCSDGLRGSSGS